jgi:glycosyltransferase involved in cell wall biosynthesis
MLRQGDDVCVVVPMYNEARVISSVLTQLRSAFDCVVCVDDGSADTSADLAEAQGAFVVRHPDNLGQGAAIQTGIDFALLDPGVKYLVTFDADGQHSVEDAVAMVGRARTAGIDVVLGSRFLHASDDEMPWSRRVLLRAAILFTRRISRLNVTDTHNGLRVLSRRAAESLNITMSGMAHASEILDQVGRRGLSFVEHSTSVAYSDYSRAKGQRNVNSVNIFMDVLGYVLRGRT